MIYNIEVSTELWEMRLLKKMPFEFLLYQLFEEFAYKNAIHHLRVIPVQLLKMKQLKETKWIYFLICINIKH